MTPTIETSIWLALKSRIDTLSPEQEEIKPWGEMIAGVDPWGGTWIPPDKVFDKAWPAETFEAPYSSAPGLNPYLRIGRVSVAPVRQLIAPGKPHMRTGFLMITLVHPLGQDLSVYDQIAGNIAAHFADGVQMTYGVVCVSITSYPHVQEGYEDNGYWTVPVRIPWRCYA